MVNDELISSRNIQPEDVEALEDAAVQDKEALAIGQAGETIVVTRPAPGQTVEIQTVPGQTYVLNFPPAEAQVQVQGDNFVLGFDDNGDGTPDRQVVFLNLVNVSEAGDAPTFQIAGVDIGGEVLLGQALALAGQDDVPLDNVAAGPGAQGGGATQYRDNLGDIINLLNAEDVIPPTELQFGLIDLEDEITILAADDTPPEGEVAPPEVVLTLPVEVDCIEEDSATDDPSNLAILTVTPNGDDLLSQIVITGLQGDWTYDFTGLGGAGITVDTSVAGQVTITFDTPSNAAYTGSFAVQPPADSDVDHPTITATATVVDPTDPTLSASGDGTLDVHVDANADGGEGSSGDDGDAEHLSVTASITDSSGEAPENDTFQPEEVGTLNVSATFDDFIDGSETHTISVFAPDGFSILESDGAGLPAGVTLVSNDGTIAVFDVETTGGVGSVDFSLSIQNTGAEEGNADFLVRVIAEETSTGDVECVDGGEGGINPVAGDNVAFVEATATAAVGNVTPPAVALSLPDQVDCILEDSGLSDPSNEVTLTVAPQGDDEITEIVISGLEPGWSYDFSGLAVDGASLTDSDATDGSISLSVPNLTSYTGSFTVQPPADSDVDHPTITATATVVDPADPGLSATGDGTLDIHVDAVADDVTVDIIVDDGDAPAGSFSPNETGTVRVVASFGDADDGSERHTVTVLIPVGFAIAALVGLPAGVGADVNTETGEVTFTLDSGVTDFDYTFEVTAPESVTSEDSFLFEATARAEDTNTPAPDVECTDENNVAEASDDETLPGFVEEVGPVLVVGENVDDDSGQTVDHRIQNPDGQPDGEIAGNNAGDVLIGDVGGGSLDGKTMNLVLVLDTSDSMEAEITFDGATMMRIQALDLAVEQLLDNLAGTEGATVRLHMVSFATNVKEVGTFNIIVDGVVDDAALQAAKDFVLGVGDNPLVAAEGNTNYEAGFNSALEWFSDGANTLDNPDFNKTIFISDGLPNRAYEGDSTTKTIVQGNTQSALNHVLGQVDLADDSKDDTISEFDGLLGTFEGVAGTVDAIGINVDTAGLAVLDQVDEGDADNITNGEELVEVLDDLTEVTQLAAVGSDVIVGNDGDDLIFGDTLFTDSLAGAEGITSVPGSGWSVIEQLIANGFFGADPEEVNQNIMDFLRDPANQELYDLGGESLADGGVGREGGHDSIDGGAGNDTIFGQEGNDTILGGNGDDLIIGGSSDDSMTGGDGSDTFRWTDATQDGEADTIVGFEAGTGGDVIDLAGLLTGVPAGPTATDLDDYLTFTSGGGNTTITIDFDGAGAGTDTSTITLHGVDLSGIGHNQAIITSLLADGNLVAVQA